MEGLNNRDFNIKFEVVPGSSEKDIFVEESKKGLIVFMGNDDVTTILNFSSFDINDKLEKINLSVNLPFVSREIDRIKIEYYLEGNVYSGILGRGKYIAIEIPDMIPVREEISEAELRDDFDLDFGGVLISIDQIVRKKIKCLDLKKLFIKFADGKIKKIAVPKPTFYIENIKKDNKEKRVGKIRIYLTFWRKKDNIPVNLLIGELNIYVIGHALIPRKDRLFVKKKNINIKGVQYQPPKLKIVNGMVVRETKVVPQNLPQGLFIIIDGTISIGKTEYKFTLSNTKKKVKGKLRPVLITKFIDREYYGTIDFGNQWFSCRRKTNLDKTLLKRGKRVNNKEYVLEWIDRHKLNHVLRTNKPFDVYIKDGEEEVVVIENKNGKETRNRIRIKYREWLIGSTDNNLDIIIFNKHHQDEYPLVRAKLNANDVLIIRHYDPSAKRVRFYP